MKYKLASALALAVLCGSILPPAPASDTESIYGRLVQMKEHSVLSVAAAEAKAAASLKADGPYTLFAPNDAAFGKLGDDAIKAIATDKKAALKLVGSHLVEGRYTTKELADYDGKELRTLQGGSLKVEKVGDGFRVGGAKVVEADLRCSNGVIHIVDAVFPTK